METGATDSGPRDRSIAATLLVIVAALFSYGWSLGAAPLAGTEGHRAVTAHQMVTSGQWLIPRLYGVPYLRKPPLHYWTLAATQRITGVAAEWVWRFPSVLATALLAGFLCWIANRWFGAPAGIVCGFSLMALLALASQSRSADVDALNTAAAVIAACCFIELLWGNAGRAWWWTLAAAGAWAAALMIKGPAGAPVVLGAILGPVVIMRRWRDLARPAPWVALAVGTAPLLLYALAVYYWARSNPGALDTSGIEEAGQTALLTDLKRLPRALVLPVVVTAAALPVSLALWLVLHRSVRDDRRRTIGLALIGSFIGALAIGLLAGITNVRYAYPALPLLCPLAGLAAVYLREGRFPPKLERGLRTVLLLSVIAFGGVAAATGCLVMWQGGFAVPLALILAAAAVFAVLAWRWLLPMNWSSAAMAGAGLILCAVICAGAAKNLERSRRSSFVAAKQLAQVVGPDARVSTGYILWSKPEFFFYADVEVTSIEHDLLRPRALEGECWLVLDQREWKAWSQQMPENLSLRAVIELHERTAYVAWYSPSAGRLNSVAAAPGAAMR